jgi:hypothetical protein
MNTSTPTVVLEAPDASTRDAINGCEECGKRFAEVGETIRKHFPELLLHFIAALSVCAILLLKKGWKPLALVFEGLPGPGKSLVLNCIHGAGEKRPIVKEKLYRSDKFTTASFVSQSANVSKGDLSKVDLLPKIRQKVLITPELAPTFRGKREEVEERFGTLARVLDGRGLTVDGGTHGRRGYEGDYAFVWLGATTPLDNTAFDAMANVGNRIFFFDTAPPRPTDEELVQLAMKGTSRNKEDECTEAIANFLEHLFTAHGNVERPEIKRPEAKYLALAARTIAKLRARVDGAAEYEYRLVEWLSQLASARAVLEGATVVTLEHLRVIQHIVVSATRPKLRPLLAALLKSPTKCLTAVEVEQRLGCSRDTALDRMDELAATGICRMVEGKPPDKPSYIELAEDTRSLIIDNFGG